MDWQILINEGGAINAIGTTEDIEIEIIASMSRAEDTMILDGLHFTKHIGGRLEPKQLVAWGRDFLRQFGNGATKLVIKGALRTTGATAGKGILPRIMTIRL